MKSTFRIPAFHIQLLFCCLCLPSAAGADRPPNIVFIFCDDLGWGDIGAHGNEAIQTPHIDDLARKGMRLTQFYVNSPVCSPSRASLLTGRFCAELGIHYAIGGPAGERYNSAPWLDPDLTTIYDVFKEAGYTIGHYGKWHVGQRDEDGKAAPPPSDYGADESGTTNSSGANLALEGEKLTNANKSEIVANRAVQFIDRHKEDPFFLSLWINDPHAVLDPTEEQMGPYLEWTHPRVRDRYRSSLTIYYAIISNIDRAVGRVVEKLEAEGLKEDTLIIFSSDNGPSPLWSSGTGHAGAGSTGPFRGTKASLYEGGVRVPFIVSWPGKVPENAVDDDSVVAAIDMMPSLASLAGIALPDDLSIDGEDLSAAILGNPVSRQNPLFWDYRFGNWGRHIQRSPRLAMRQGDWKLLMNPDSSRVELYNVAQDHSETSNLFTVEAARADAMRVILLNWLDSKVPDPEVAPEGAGELNWAYPQDGDL